LGYLMRLPGAMKEIAGKVSASRSSAVFTRRIRCALPMPRCSSTAPSISARSRIYILGHRPVTTTQIYDKRRRGTSDSASHLLVI
jgi:hypothetical protein